MQQTTNIPNRLILTEEQMPKFWYNLRADMDEIPPLLNPGTLQPMTEDELSMVFPRELARQELDNTTAYVPIPEEVQEMYRIYRPSPLIRAYSLEKALGTPAKIYYKFEGGNTSGSHKLNSAAAQAYYAKKQGLKAITTETGAGQWGTALSEASARFGIPLTVFMVKSSYHQKPARKTVMQTFGADVIPSPSMDTQVGRKINGDMPGCSGSLGCAISEAVERAVTGDDVKYVLGSVLNLVLLHQSVIGLECETAFNMLGEYPDVIVGCIGGGSNLGGLIAPFMRDKLQGKRNPRIVGVEPASCPSLTRGVYAYDFCDSGMITPLAKMYTLGATFMPPPEHAGGLRYHGMSPLISKLYADGLMEAIAVKQTEVFDAGVFFAKHETILPAPESSHAVYGAIREALKCKETGEAKTILFGLTGTGNFDMPAYALYNNGEMTNTIPTDADLKESLDRLPKTGK